MSAKRFVIGIVGLLCLFFAANIVLWHSGVRHIFLGENGHGNLGRMSGLYFSMPETVPMQYSAVHTEFEDYLMNGQPKEFDVVTIGDSFSNGDGGNYYQDYLVDRYHWSILNVPCRHFNNALSILYIMDEVGYLDEVKPKIVILESLVPNMAWRFGEVPFEIPLISREGFFQSQQLTKEQQKIRQDIEGERWAPAVMVKGNASVLEDRWYGWTHLGSGKPSKKTRMVRLTKAVFTNPGMEDILVYPEGWGDPQYAEEVAVNINANMNEAATFLAKKGIRLVFLPMVDRYDLYYPYFENQNGWKENPLLSQLEKLPRQYTLINTKAILRKTLEESDIRDLYWADEDHFSWKAYHIICDEIVRKIQP